MNKNYKITCKEGGISLTKETLRINMFGRLTLECGDRVVSCSSNRSKMLWNILAYLIWHRGEFVSADDLISIIWKPEKNGNPSGAMRTAIHRVRSMIDEVVPDGGNKYLIAKSGGYTWDPNLETEIDVLHFDSLVSSLNEDGADTNVESCLDAIRMYSGKFLSMQSSELWVTPIQVYYHNLYEKAIEKVVPALEKSGSFSEGVDICKYALQIDPYSERIHQHLMRFLLVLDERREVIKVYEDMSKLLLSSFGIMPDQESRALYREALRTADSTKSFTPDSMLDALGETGEIKGALICDYDFFRVLYQAQARTIMRLGAVIHTVLFTVEKRADKDASGKSLMLFMDNLEKHLCSSLRKGDVITRCNASQLMVMLPAANYENSCKVCKRVVSSFEKKHPSNLFTVDYFVQALRPSSEN